MTKLNCGICEAEIDDRYTKKLSLEDAWAEIAFNLNLCDSCYMSVIAKIKQLNSECLERGYTSTAQEA